MGAIGRETRFFVIGSVVLVGVAVAGYWAWRRRRFEPSTTSRRRRRSVKVTQKQQQPRIPSPTSNVSTARSSSTSASLRRSAKKGSTTDKEWEQVSVGPLSDESESIVDCSAADRVRTPLPSSRRREPISVSNTDSASDNFDFCPVIPHSPTKTDDNSSGKLAESPATPPPQPPQKQLPIVTPTPNVSPAPGSTPVIPASPDTLSPSTPQSPLPTTPPPSVGNLSAPSTPASTTGKSSASGTMSPSSSLRVMCDCRISRDSDNDINDENELFPKDLKFTPSPTIVYPISFEKHEPPNLTITGPELVNSQLTPQALKRFHLPGAQESILTAFRPVLNSLVYANKHAFVVMELSENYQYLE